MNHFQEVFNKNWETIADQLFSAFVAVKSESVQIHIRDATEALINKLNKDQLQKLFDKTQENFESVFPYQKRFAVKFCATLAKLKKDLFLSKLDLILPNLVLCLIPRAITLKTTGKFVRNEGVDISDSEDEEAKRKPKKKKRKISDFSLELQLLDTMNAIEIIYEAIPSLLTSNADTTEQFTSAAVYLVEHENQQIVSKAIDLVEKFLQMTGDDKLKAAMMDNSAALEIMSSPRADVQQLVVNLCNKLAQCNELDEVLIEKVLGLIGKLIPIVAEIPDNFEAEQDFNVPWICREIRKIFNESSAEETQNLTMVSLF